VSIVEKALSKLRTADRATVKPAPERNARSAVAPAARPVVPQTSAVPRANASITLDHVRLRAMGLEPPTDGDVRRLNDELRRVKWALLKLGSNEPAANVLRNVLVISSALPGEGKSFTSFNLALSVATESDRRVWLIDSDTVRPHISQGLAIQDRPGFLDAIADPSAQLEDVLIPTDLPGLSVIPSGRARADAPELLGSARTAQLLAAVQSAYPDVVIVIDTAPILATSVPQALAPIAGLFVLAVKADATPVKAVREAISQLHRTEGVALVLNQLTAFAGNHYYDGYYDPPDKT